MRETVQPAIEAQAPGRLRRAVRGSMRALRGNPNMALGLIIIVFMVSMAAAAPLVTAHDPIYIDVRQRLQSPSATHWFGTDDVGRDVYSRTIYGARVSLTVGLVVASLDVVGGIVLGLFSGYYRRADAFIMRIMDALWSIPAFLLALALVAVFGAGVLTVIFAAATVFLPTIARLVRASVLTLREVDFVEAARAIGAEPLRIMFRHILPNSFAPALVQATYVFAVAMLLEAGLSFLGTGVPPGIPTWGNVMGDGRRSAQIALWILFFPGLFLTLSVLAVNLIGDGFRDVLDPKLRGKL